MFSSRERDQPHLLFDLLGGVVAAGEQRLAGFISGPEAVLMGVDLPLERNTHTHTPESQDTVCVCVCVVTLLSHTIVELQYNNTVNDCCQDVKQQLPHSDWLLPMKVITDRVEPLALC